MACPLTTERVWVDKSLYSDAERDHFQKLKLSDKGSVIINNNKENNITKNSADNTKIVEGGIVSSATSKSATSIVVIDNNSLDMKKQQQPPPPASSLIVNSDANVQETDTSASATAATSSIKKKKMKKSKVKSPATPGNQPQWKKLLENLVVDNVQQVDKNLINPPSIEDGADFGIYKIKKKKNKKITTNTRIISISTNTSSTSRSCNNTADTNLITNNKTITKNGNNGNSGNSGNSIIENKNEDHQIIELPSALPPSDKKKVKKPKNKSKNNKGLGSNQCTLVREIAKARQHIKNSLERMDGIAALAASPPPPPPTTEVLDRLGKIEKDNLDIQEMVAFLKKSCKESSDRVKILETKLEELIIRNQNIEIPGLAPKPPQKQQPEPKKSNDDDDDGVDLFGSDSEGENEEAAKVREERLAAYAAKKSKKPALIAKSSILLDVKPWDDETDLKMMETEIRKIKSDGLLWGASKFMPVAFGIQKLSIGCVVEDEKVSIDWLTEEIEKFEDFVQSVDIAAFNKI